ncbi:hypothetical protein A2U01_0050353, partial [Trifolium medium]|nr:hypothetical protein [Trifolium medium]
SSGYVDRSMLTVSSFALSY